MICALVAPGGLGDAPAAPRVDSFDPGLAIAGAPVEGRMVTIDPPSPLPFGEMTIAVNGWPDTCSSVELDYLDGSVGGNDEGAVLGSWGTLELAEGAGSKAVTAPGPEEYNLRVSGPPELCGDPFYSPDFGVSSPRPPQPLGRVAVFVEGDDPETGIRIEADEWPDDCPWLDVHVESFLEETVVPLGVLQLVSGRGTLTAPQRLLAVFGRPDPFQDGYWVDVVARGPVDRCGGPYQTEIGATDWPPATHPPPEPFGQLAAAVLPDDPATGIRIEAEGWPDDCPSLDVQAKGHGGRLVPLGVLRLESGRGALTATPSLLLELDPPDEDDYWFTVVAVGPADRCGVPANIDVTDEGWPPATHPPASVQSATATEPASGVAGDSSSSTEPNTLPSTGTRADALMLIGSVALISGAALLIGRRRRAA